MNVCKGSGTPDRCSKGNQPRVREHNTATTGERTRRSGITSATGRERHHSPCPKARQGEARVHTLRSFQAKNCIPGTATARRMRQEHKPSPTAPRMRRGQRQADSTHLINELGNGLGGTRGRGAGWDGDVVQASKQVGRDERRHQIRELSTGRRVSGRVRKLGVVRDGPGWYGTDAGRGEGGMQHARERLPTGRQSEAHQVKAPATTHPSLYPNLGSNETLENSGSLTGKVML